MNIEIQIASVPDREKVVAELWISDRQIAEISNEDGEMRIEFYSAPGSTQLSLSLDDLLKALNKAKRNLAV